ncbi:MAG: 23S rRNA (adenine(2503)-C(2))-methyltransferase RlmN, partial [Nitrospiraceae bacterium]
MALSAVQMNAMVQEFRWPPYRTEQILRWLYQQRVRDIHQMTDLSKPEREHLMAIASIRRIEDCQILSSEDGTQKFLMKLDDGLLIETVLIPDEGRLTLCLSTQIGCTLDCGFCLTATLGLKRNLHAHEIVEQVLTVQDHLGSWQVITNIVLMGMGEPLANLGAVSEAIARITSKNWGLGFSPRRITLSTAGLAPRIKDVAGLGVNLAVSLNATTDDQRDRLMPAINHLYPLKALMTACRN